MPGRTPSREPSSNSYGMRANTRDPATPDPASPNHTAGFASASTGVLVGTDFGFGFAADLLGMIRTVILFPSIVGARSTVPAVANFARTESNTLRPSS